MGVLGDGGNEKGIPGHAICAWAWRDDTDGVSIRCSVGDSTCKKRKEVQRDEAGEARGMDSYAIYIILQTAGWS